MNIENWEILTEKLNDLQKVLNKMHIETEINHREKLLTYIFIEVLRNPKYKDYTNDEKIEEASSLLDKIRKAL